MDDIELTQVFVNYANAKKELERLELIIKEEVTKRGESMKVAGVEAKYYQPSYETPDYEGAVREWWNKHPEDTHAYMDDCSTTTVTVSWKKVCAYLLLDPPPGVVKPARVVVK